MGTIVGHASPTGFANMKWDIFCKVIDNHGDIGVCWRLAADLADRGHQVRLMADDLSALLWMAPNGHPMVQVRHWPSDLPEEIADTVVAAFSCDLDEATLERIARRRQQGDAPAWFNLEYLSAEAFSERAHLCEAPVRTGAAAGSRRTAFYPGFTPATGGLLRESGLAARRASFDREAWLDIHGVRLQGQALVSMFCYEPDALRTQMSQWIDGSRPVTLLVCAGRSAAAVHRVLSESIRVDAQRVTLGQLSVLFLPLLTQLDYDHLLWSCDLNFVRGEDSLVRAMWADKPWVWQIYPQDDGAHESKFEALMNRAAMPASLKQYMRGWNGLGPVQLAPDVLDGLSAFAPLTQTWHSSLLAQPDLTSQLIQVASRSG